MHATISWKSVCYQSTKYGADLKLSHHLPICTTYVQPFPGLLFSFLSLIESQILQQSE